MSQGHEAPPAQQMFQMITGHWVSQTAGAISELRIMDVLADRPSTAAEVAARVKTDPRATERLLRAAACVGMVRHEAGRYAPTPLGETLRSDVPGSLRDMAIAQTAPGHWLPWGRFTDAIRTGGRQTPAALGMELWDHYAKNPAEGAAFSGAMKDLSMMVAGEVARALDTTGVRRIVDVGGATGTLLAAVVGKNPALGGILVDLPHVVDGARRALDDEGLGVRCEVIGGDFFRSIPDGDIYLLKQILHDWDDEQCQVILRNCARGMRAGGRVVIVEMVIPDDLRPSPAQLMDLNMLVLLSGRERTRSEYAGLLEASGLRLEKVTETHSPFQIVEAVAI